jgi:hypothetical protein
LPDRPRVKLSRASLCIFFRLHSCSNYRR